MARANRIIRNLYRDSVALMQLSARLSAISGVEQASAVMATEANLALLAEAGLVDRDIDPSPSDLLIVMTGDEEALAAAMSEADGMLSRTGRSDEAGDRSQRIPPRSIQMGLDALPEANLALISTPGEYAAAEAFKALRMGLNVMLFSDNVDLADEIALKAYARDNGLIVMGPDCGTAIIDGIPLGFANAVQRGDIGCVAASGTGLQQVTCLVDRWGAGISQAIGTGGRDLKAAVGGETMLRGITALAEDRETAVITLISKPPAAEIAERVLEVAERAGKPVVVNFIGADPAALERPNVHPARTLEDAARIAVALSLGERPTTPDPPAALVEAAAASAADLAPGQIYLRGLFSGGTFCYEALLLLTEALGPVFSSTPLDPDCALADPWRSHRHTVIDLGDDQFTRGRPHPMIDTTLRAERILREASDPEVAVILLDVVLGFGAHADPADEIGSAVEEAQSLAKAAGRHLVFVGSVCGTAADPQGLADQEARLRKAGVILADSNALAVRLCAGVLARNADGKAARSAAGKAR